MDDSKNETENTVKDDKAGKFPAKGPAEQTPPREIGGRGGPDPVRYGDWENNGIASDF